MPVLMVPSKSSNSLLEINPLAFPPLTEPPLKPLSDIFLTKPHKSPCLDMRNKLLMRPLVDCGGLDTRVISNLL